LEKVCLEIREDHAPRQVVSLGAVLKWIKFGWSVIVKKGRSSTKDALLGKPATSRWGDSCRSPLFKEKLRFKKKTKQVEGVQNY